MLFPPQVDPKASTAAQGQMNNAKIHTMPTCGPVVLGSSQVSGAQQGNVAEQDFEEEAPLREEDTMKIHEHLIGVHLDCYCASNDLDRTTCARLLQQAIQGMNIHYAPADALEANYGDTPADVDTTAIVVRQPRASSIQPQVQQHHVHRHRQQQIMTAPVMNTISLREIEGQVAEYWWAPLLTTTL